jgi:hypothetical protein
VSTLLGPLSVRYLLFGSQEAEADELMSSSARQAGVGAAVGRAVGGLTAAGRDTVCHEVGHVADTLLDIDVTDVIAAAWKKHADLRAAGRRTALRPGSEEVVSLATHTITSTHRPYVDVYVDDVEITRIDIELTLRLVLTGVLALVREGYLVALHAGTCDVTARLGCEHVQLAERTTSLSIPGTMRLRRGIDLRPDPAPGGRER